MSLEEQRKLLRAAIYKEEPPTPEEFLNPENGWLSRGYARSIREWVKEDFVNIADFKNRDKSIIVQYGATRRGKSFLAGLLIYYQIVHSLYLRSFTDFYLMAESSSLAIFILSFNFKKVDEIYLGPLYRLLESSPRCKKVKFQDQVKLEQDKEGTGVLVWSKAAIVGHITLASGLQVVSGNDDALGLLGNNIVSAYISEINFWCEYSGTTEDTIYRLYTDVSERIKATVGAKAYLSWTYLDSSANHTDSVIEKHIIKDLIPDPNVYSRWEPRWEVKELQEVLYPEWKKTGKTFRVFLGDGQNPPKILNHGEKVSGDIIEVPIDALKDFEKNLVKSIRDIAGRPTVSEMKFIPQEDVIDKFMSYPLWNIEAGVVCDSMDKPEGLIFEKVKPLFTWAGNRYVLKRAPKEPRFLSVDLAYSVKGDVAGISMTHKEQKGHEIIYVLDFCFAVLPGPNGISLDAIASFVIELCQVGMVPIEVVSADRFYKESIFQKIKRALPRIEVVTTSVDTSLDPYVFFYQLMLSENVACGYNEFLKNNLRSLYRTRNKKGREVIDHSNGITNHIFSSRGCGCGIHEKDVSDSGAASIWNCYNYEGIPQTSFDAENNRLYKSSTVSLIDRFYGKG